MNIEIGEKVCIRLSVFADKNNLSLSAAIERLLNNRPPSSSAVSRLGYSRLEIVYFPAGEENFKRALLAIDSSRRVAYIRIHAQGRMRPEYKQWRAENIDKDSSIRGNLMSGHLRHWKLGSVFKAEVSLEPFADGVSQIVAPSVRQAGGVETPDQRGADLREQAKSLVLDFMGSLQASQPGESGISQTDIFRNCGLDWGDFPLAKSNNQVSWLNALMWRLKEEGKVERKDTNWRLTED